MINDVRLTYTETELESLNGYIADIKNNRKDHVATVIHEWRLACLSMSLAGNDTEDVGEDGDYQYLRPETGKLSTRGPPSDGLGRNLCQSSSVNLPTAQLTRR